MSPTALVLGAGGFLGSHLTRGLVDRGWSVTGVTRDPEASHVLTRLRDVTADIRLVASDARDPDVLHREVAGVDAVFPFAGHSGAARSLREPFEDLHGNATPQLALLEALRRVNPAARVVFPGSRLQYGRPGELPVRETHPQVPTSLYGLHKLLGEQYHRLYHELYGIASTCLRISNPYGPHQHRSDEAFGVVGTFLATAHRGGDITLYGGGTQLREYVYVRDLVEVCVAAATGPVAVGRVYNVGGPRPMPLREMAEAVVRTVGRGRLVDVPWPSLEAQVETGDYVGDLTRIGDELDWAPSTDLDEGLALTYEALAPVLARGSAQP